MRQTNRQIGNKHVDVQVRTGDVTVPDAPVTLLTSLFTVRGELVSTLVLPMTGSQAGQS